MNRRFTEQEKLTIKLKLLESMESFLESETEEDNNYGWIPHDLSALMANAAFAVIEAVNATNSYIEENDLFK